MAAKVAFTKTLTGSFEGDETQRQARLTTTKANQHVDAIAVLNNRAYITRTTDTGNIGVAAYATLVSTTITTLLYRGYLIINFTASGAHPTNAGSVFFQVLVDNVIAKACILGVAANFTFNASMVVRVAVVKGVHTVALRWKTDVLDANINPVTAAEHHAHLLVQEAA